MNKYYTEEWETKIKNACDQAESMSQACASLGMYYTTFSIHAKRLNVFNPNQSGKGMVKHFPKIPLSEIIYDGKHPQYRSGTIRKRLIKEGIKEHKCNSCNGTKWLDNPIPLELHHKDGNHYNHLLENLELLCPNCHTCTDNYGSKNHKAYDDPIAQELENRAIIKSKEEPRDALYKRLPEIFCKVCNEHILDKRGKFCSSECYRKHNRQNIPKVPELIKAFNKYKSYVQVGKHFGVSDNAVRKWVKSYGIEPMIKKSLRYKTKKD